MEIRTCLACEKPLVRHSDEQTSHWEKRRSCNHACAGVARWQRDKVKLPAKTCSICGTNFEKVDAERNWQFKRRVTCSTSCHQTLVVRNRDAKRTDIPEKWCVVCGVQMELRVGTETRGREHISSFKARKTCGPECHAGLLSRQKIAHNAEIRATPYPPKFTDALKQSIRDRDGHICQCCGATEGRRAFDVHHIDYDKENCIDSNLITLCRACHRKTTFEDRNEWAGRLSGLLFERIAA